MKELQELYCMNGIVYCQCCEVFDIWPICYQNASIALGECATDTVIYKHRRSEKKCINCRNIKPYGCTGEKAKAILKLITPMYRIQSGLPNKLYNKVWNTIDTLIRMHVNGETDGKIYDRHLAFIQQYTK